MGGLWRGGSFFGCPFPYPSPRVAGRGTFSYNFKRIYFARA